jgi:hypothetical protein
MAAISDQGISIDPFSALLKLTQIARFLRLHYRAKCARRKIKMVSPLAGFISYPYKTRYQIHAIFGIICSAIVRAVIVKSFSKKGFNDLKSRRII